MSAAASVAVDGKERCELGGIRRFRYGCAFGVNAGTARREWKETERRRDVSCPKAKVRLRLPRPVPIWDAGREIHNEHWCHNERRPGESG